jgi:hypothetical protein
MAVRALPRTRARVPHQTAHLSPAVLVLTLIAPALDLLAIVEPSVFVPIVGVAATAGAGTVLLLVWARYPRTSWLAAASLASFASLGMRLVGADAVAPVLSLLAVVALGLGGAFASPGSESERLLRV